MDHAYCPGARMLRQPAPEIFTCPDCGGEVEIWTDELRGTCPQCKRIVLKESTQSCLDWCKYAKECVGDETYGRHMQNRMAGVKAQFLSAMSNSSGDDGEYASGAAEAVDFAEQLLSAEEADAHIVIPACLILYARSADDRGGDLNRILLKTGFQRQDIEQISDISARNPPAGIAENKNYRVAHDAYMLARRRGAAPAGKQTPAARAPSFLTAKATEIYQSLATGA